MVVNEAGEDPRAAVLIEAAALHRRMRAGRPPVVIAVRSDDTTAPRPFDHQPRIPGAVEADLGADLAGPGGGPGGARPLPDLAALQGRVRAWGIRQDSEVVLYDHDGGLQAARGWWVLRWAGLGGVRLLDGGFAAWVGAGLPTDRQPGTPPPGDAVLSAGHLPVLDADQAAALARAGVLLDTRIAPNYRGGETRPGEPPRGHVPGARNLPAAELLAPDGRFADPATLRQRFAARGLDGTAPVGLYCGAGVSAAHAVAALLSLGITAPMYPGSWSAWSTDPRRPVAIGPEPG